ncbi:GPI ethanolamine phosphate transferase 1, partial [Taenia solium]
WKANIRPFNAILHNTQFSWAYGHPVALSSFKLLPDDPRNQRLKLEHYSAVSYSHSYADDFVLDKFQAFVKSDLPKFVEQDGETDDGRCGKLIFLHLSSVDDVAHRVGTKDSLFYQTVDNADKVVEKVYHHFRLSLSREDLATTAFIVTADHGTKPEGGHGGSTDDEIYVPYFIWGAGISQKPQQNLLGDSPILPQNSMSIFMASLLSTILPSNSQALLRRSNRHSILPLFYAHEEDLPNDLGILLEKEVKLQDSLRIARWAAWFVDFIFWTISMVFLSLALSINLTDSQPCIPRSKIRFYTRLGIFGLASIELYRDYTKEPNYQEMNILSFGCIVCEISLCGYATVGRKLLVKLFKSTGPQRGQILRFLLAILQTYLTVRGFDEPRHFAAAGALLVADLVFDETVRRKGKHHQSLFLVASTAYRRIPALSLRNEGELAESEHA